MSVSKGVKAITVEKWSQKSVNASDSDFNMLLIFYVYDKT